MALTGALSLLAPALGSARAIAEEPVDGPSVDGPDGSDEGAVDGAARTAAEAAPMVDGMTCDADFAIAKVYARDGLRSQFGMLALEKYARFVDGVEREKDIVEGDKPLFEPWDVRLEGATEGIDPTIADLGDGKLEEWWWPFLVVDSMPATMLADPDIGDLAAGSALVEGLDIPSRAGSASPGIASELSEPKPIDEIDTWPGTEAEFLDEVLHPWAVETLGLAPEDMTGYAVLILEDVRSDGDPAVGLQGVRLRIPVRAQDLSDAPSGDHFDLLYGEEGLFADLGEIKKDGGPSSSGASGLGGLVGPLVDPEETVPFPGRTRGTIVVDLEVIESAVDVDADDGEASVCVLAGVARFRPAGGGDGGSDDDATAGPVPTSVPSGEGPSDRLPGLVFGIGLTAAGAAAVRRRLAPRPETVAPVG